LSREKGAEGFNPTLIAYNNVQVLNRICDEVICC